MKKFKKIGVMNVVDQKIRVKYLRDFYELNGLGKGSHWTEILNFSIQIKNYQLNKN